MGGQAHSHKLCRTQRPDLRRIMDFLGPRPRNMSHRPRPLSITSGMPSGYRKDQQRRDQHDAPPRLAGHEGAAECNMLHLLSSNFKVTVLARAPAASASSRFDRPPRQVTNSNKDGPRVTKAISRPSMNSYEWAGRTRRLSRGEVLWVTIVTMIEQVHQR